MNADAEASIVQVLDAAQRNIASLGNLAAGIGQNLNITAESPPRRTARQLARERRLNQLDRILARPFGGTSDAGDLATLRVNQ